MAASKAGMACWLGLITLLWSLHPLLFSRERGVLVMVVGTAVLALLGWLLDLQFLVAWSGGLGLVTLTVTLMLTAQTPNLWLGLSAGITLLALLDGSQRFAYLRHCQVEPGVLTAFLGVFLRLTGLSLASGVALALLVVSLPTHGAVTPAAGLLTIAGAGLFVGVVALFLLYTGRRAERGGGTPPVIP
jgi:hypothetical protein